MAEVIVTGAYIALVFTALGGLLVMAFTSDEEDAEMWRGRIRRLKKRFKPHAQRTRRTVVRRTSPRRAAVTRRRANA